MSYTRIGLMRFASLLVLGSALAACGDSGTAEPRGLGLLYCDNPDAEPVAASCAGWAVGDDAEVRAKLEGCAVTGCHGATGGFTNWGIDLSGSVEDALTALTIPGGTGGYYLVDDQDPDCSMVLSEVSERPVGTVRMPVTGNYWSAAEVDCFRAYLHEISN